MPGFGYNRTGVGRAPGPTREIHQLSAEFQIPLAVLCLQNMSRAHPAYRRKDYMNLLLEGRWRRLKQHWRTRCRPNFYHAARANNAYKSCHEQAVREAKGS